MRKNTVIPFVKAGMSSPIYPTWEKYLRLIPDKHDEKAVETLNELLKKDPCDYEEAVQYLHDRYGIAFYDRTKQVFSPHKLVPERVNKAAFHIPLLFEGPVITTNLDQQLEWLYQGRHIPFPVGLAGETGFISEQTNVSKPCLWKIHGDIDKSDAWVFTTEQYNRLYNSGDNEFLQLFHTFLQHKVLLFLGSGLRSDKIVTLLKELFQKNRHIRHYAILPVPEDDVYFDEFSRLGNLGIIPIWYPQGDYDSFEGLIWELVQQSGKRGARSYMPPNYPVNPPGYVMREHELAAIEDKFHCSNIVTLKGIGGIGKTQLAAAYLASKSREDIIYIKCSTKEIFHQSQEEFLKAESLLPLDSVKPVKEDFNGVFRQALEGRNHYLVFFDDVNDTSIFSYIASLPRKGRYIVTTCRQYTGELAGTELEVSGMSDDEAYHLLKSRNMRIIKHAKSEWIKELNQFCGGIPLALEQAASYMAETGEDLENYLLLIRPGQFPPSSKKKF